MHKITKNLLSGCIFALFTQPVLAEDDEVSIIGGMGYNIKRAEFSVGNKPFKPEFTTVDLSIIAAYKSFYVKAGFDQSIKDHFQINNTPSSDGRIDNGIIQLQREDADITIGYNVINNISIFAGYTRGETSGISTTSIDINGSGPTLETSIFHSTLSFKQTGPFIGASYSYYLQDSGAFNFSLAYADLDGDIVFSEAKTFFTTAETTLSSFEIQGKSTGLSYGVTWTDQFSENMLYNISLKIKRYKFDGPLAPGGDDFDFDDNYNIVSISFSKFF